MFRNLKLKTENRKIWFGSDFHLDHDKEFLWGARGFDNKEDHKKKIFDDLAEYLAPDDAFVYLGDFSLNSSLESTVDDLKRFSCKEVYYIWGNHESYVWKVYKQEMENQFGRSDIEVYPLKYENITFLGHKVKATVDKKPIVLTHMAQAVWDLMQHESFNVVGHSHGNYPKANVRGPQAKLGKILDVGVDNALDCVNRSFFEWEEAKEILNQKEREIVDHHDGTGNG